MVYQANSTIISLKFEAVAEKEIAGENICDGFFTENYTLNCTLPFRVLIEMRVVIKPFLAIKSLESILLLLSLFLFTNHIKAQSPPVVFRNFTVNEGLSHNFVRGFLHDSRGFMWIATIDGLNKFDGYTFKTYKTTRNDTTSLPSNNIANALAEDANGNIWIGTWGGGICIYNRKLDTFKRIGQEVPSKFIYSLYKDSKNRIWIGTSDNGLILADPNKLTFTQFLHDSANPSSPGRDGIQSITEDDKGNLWIGTLGGGLYQFNPETKQFIHYVHEESDHESLANNVVTNVFFDSKKRLWVGNSNNTLSVMKNQPGKFSHFTHQPNDPKSIGDYHITAIEENDNKIWIGTDFGLMLYNERDNNFYHYHSKPFDHKSISSNQIKAVVSDRQGRLWIGTYNGGVSIFDKSHEKVLHYYTYLGENSLGFNDVSAFQENDDGSMLIGTDGGGLNTFDRKTGKFVHYKYDPNNVHGIGGNFIKSILKDKTGRIWIGLWGSGLNIFDRKKQTFSPFNDSKARIDGTLSTANVTCLVEDNEGFIWASTWGNGVYRIDPAKPSFENFVFDSNDANSLSNIYSWAIYADSKNNIWVGSSDGVLELYNRDTRKFKHFNTTPPGENGAGILVISEDSKGRIWAGLEGGGLKLLDQKTGTFKTYDIAAGLPSNYVSSIEEDQHGYLWLGTNNSIARFDPETGKVKNYGLNYGFQSLQFNRQASIKLKSGEMMFGGVNGFNVFHPDSLDEISRNFHIAFTDFQIFNKPVPIGKKGSPLAEDINEISEITLPSSNSVFSLEYAALNFMDPRDTQYKYRLKGFVDDVWQEVGNERKVTYTNLDPGTYTFMVKASNKDGLWNEEGASLVINVLPPLWKTWWFRTGLGVLIVGLVIGFYKLRVNTIEQQNKKLERLVAERTEELVLRDEEIQAQNNDLYNQREELASQNDKLKIAREIIEKHNDEIKLRNESLEEEVKDRTKDLIEYNQLLEQFAFISAHNLRAPVARILGLGNILELAKDEPEEESKIVSKLVYVTRELDTVVKDLNTILVLRKDNISVITEVNLEEELRLIKINLEKEILETETKIWDDFSRVNCIHTIKPYLDSILINLISNAIKYRHPDRYPVIQLKSEILENYICLTVHDNGLGINLELHKEKLFTLYGRFHNHVEGKGMGLYLVKTQVVALGGKIEVESEINYGTIFKIFFKRFD